MKITMIVYSNFFLANVCMAKENIKYMYKQKTAQIAWVVR